MQTNTPNGRKAIDCSSDGRELVALVVGDRFRMVDPDTEDSFLECETTLSDLEDWE